MSDDALGRLAATLGVPTERLAPLATYADEHLARLDELLNQAMTNEVKAFDKALEDAVGIVPRPLRGAAKRMLGGGGRG